ncbi:MAG: hypothetical protein J0H74_14560 [Chitinophagaceae bacterium]|nr:hypothetical protein [Chitinophagaceae bacterium]
MKNIFFFLLTAVIAPVVNAQVVINPQLPPGGLTVKSQLWNLSVVNTSNGSIQAQIELSMIDASNNQTVLTATTRVLDFPKGMKQLHAGEAAPVTYNILSADYHLNGSADGFLPVGTFQLCYSVIRVDLETSERVAEECETVVIEPISPPQLVNPPDSGETDLTHPLFNWLPPSPYQLFTNLTYDFNLVEVQAMQTAAEALQQNMPLNGQGNLTTTTLQYPASLPALDTGKLYAWQVTARSGNAEVARSEVWSFRVKAPLPDPGKTSLGYYTRLKQGDAPGFTVCYGILRFEYLNEANDRQAPFRIYDISQPGRKEILLDSTLIDLHYGEHLGQLDFTRSHVLQDTHVYLFELINSRKEHWYIKFQYHHQH